MAPLSFNADKIKENRLFAMTFGASRETTRWVDVKRFNFKQLSDFLSNDTKVGKKDGKCYTPAVFEGHTRTLQASRQIDIAVLDSDCGHSLEQIQGAIASRGWRAIIHSTYSHLTDQTAMAASAFYKWREENPGRTVADYMVAKKGFLPAIANGAHIVDESTETRGSNLIIKHAPCPKFRIILPLLRPWVSGDYDSQDLANAKWRERIGALASALGLFHDQSCSDTSRLFYLPRVRDDAAYAAFVCVTLAGEDCDVWSLPDAQPIAEADSGPMAGLFEHYRKAAVGAARGDGAGGAVGNVVSLPRKTFTDKATGEIFDLTAWARRYGGRFEIGKAIAARSPAIISERKAGVKTHIYCVRSGNHLTGGYEGTGTYVVNASELPRSGLSSRHSGFVIQCMHNGCRGADRLDHLWSMLDTGALSIGDLTDPEFLSGDIESVDISAFTAKIENLSNAAKNAKVESEPKTPTQADIERENESNIAPYLYKDLPGAMGAMHKFILATSPKPQPVLALGAVLAFCASAIGQRVQLEGFKTRPNIYVLNVAISGSGKDRPMSACKQMAHAAGLQDQLIGVEEIASDSGVITSVVSAPRQLMLIDEAHELINAMNNQNAGQHLKGVIPTLLRLYSSSSQSMKGKSYADKERLQVIDQPCVSLLGSCTPRGLGDALTNKDIESGLLSRVVIFDVGSNDMRARKPDDVSTPEEIIEWINAWNAVKPIQNPMKRIGGEAVIEPRVVMMTEEASQIAESFEGEMFDAKQKAVKNGKEALYVRAHENALKFALIRACAIWPIPNAAGTGLMIDEGALRVDGPTMRWAVDLSRATVARMVDATEDIADTSYQKDLKGLRKAIRRAGIRGMTERDLARSPAGRMSPRVLGELLDTLQAAGDIKKYQEEKNGRGRKREPFVYKEFFGILGLKSDDEDDDDGVMAGE